MSNAPSVLFLVFIFVGAILFKAPARQKGPAERKVHFAMGGREDFRPDPGGFLQSSKKPDSEDAAGLQKSG